MTNDTQRKRSTADSGKQRSFRTLLKKVLIGICVWFVTMILLAVIGSIIWPVDSGKTMSPIYSLVVVLLPILLAFRAAGVKIRSKENSKKEEAYVENIKIESPPQKPVIEQTPVDNQADFKMRKYRVAGTSFRTESIVNVATENPDYELSKKELIENGMTDERVWEYKFYPTSVRLVPEPDNPNDPNAIKVIVDGEHIGYIKSGSCAHLLKVIQEDRILDISCEMGGGPYKYVSEEYDEDKDKDVYILERDKTNFFAELTIREKQ